MAAGICFDPDRPYQHVYGIFKTAFHSGRNLRSCVKHYNVCHRIYSGLEPSFQNSRPQAFQGFIISLCQTEAVNANMIKYNINFMVTVNPTYLIKPAQG